MTVGNNMGVSDSIVYYGQANYYQITAQEDGEILVTLRIDSYSDGRYVALYIYDSEGNQIGKDTSVYNGDSIRALREHAPDLQVTLAMEPDRRNLRKLEAYAATLREAQDPLTVIPVGAGAWSEDTTLTFHGSGNRNAGLTDAPATAPADALLPSTAENPYFGKSESVPVRAPDSLLAECTADGRMPADTRVDFIKYDVEGAEREALLGSRAVIERDAPALLVSVYHRSGDIFTLPRLVHDLNPTYRLYLRRMAGLPAWDINLYAVVD